LRKYFIELVSRVEALEKFLPALRQAFEQSSQRYEEMRTQHLLLRSEIEPLRNLADTLLKKENDAEN